MARSFGKQQEQSKNHSLLKDIKSDRNQKINNKPSYSLTKKEECNLTFNNNNNITPKNQKGMFILLES